MTDRQVGQVFSCWSNVTLKKSNFGTSHLYYLIQCNNMTMTLVKSSPKGTPSNDRDMTNLWPRFDQVILVYVMSEISWLSIQIIIMIIYSANKTATNYWIDSDFIFVINSGFQIGWKSVRNEFFKVWLVCIPFQLTIKSRKFCQVVLISDNQKDKSLGDVNQFL